MTVTRSDVLRFLQSDEPDYEAAAELGAEAVEHLIELAAEGDPLLAAKATSLAGRIGTRQALLVVRAAAGRDEAAVRVAAAAALGRMPAIEDRFLIEEEDPGGRLLEKLLEDDDPGVSRFAARSRHLRTRGSPPRDTNEPTDDPEPAGGVR